MGVVCHKLLLRGDGESDNCGAVLNEKRPLEWWAAAEIWLLCSMKNCRQNGGGCCDLGAEHDEECCQNGVGEVMVITLPVTGWVKVRLRACRHRRVPPECLPYNVSPTMGQPRPC